MDELTLERYPGGVPWSERYRKPGPRKCPKLPVADPAVIAERRRVLLGERRLVQSVPGITVVT